MIFHSYQKVIKLHLPSVWTQYLHMHTGSVYISHLVIHYDVGDDEKAVNNTTIRGEMHRFDCFWLMYTLINWYRCVLNLILIYTPPYLFSHLYTLYCMKRSDGHHWHDSNDEVIKYDAFA